MSAPFSNRYGFSVREALQYDSLEPGTRNRIWTRASQGFPSDPFHPGVLDKFYIAIMDRVFMKMREDWPVANDSAYSWLRAKWSGLAFNHLFDIIQLRFETATDGRIILANDEIALSDYARELNEVLIDEGVGWRIRGSLIVPVLEEEQLDTIDTAVNSPATSDGARKHIIDALTKLRSPDSGPSDVIREAIHAVEAEAQKISGKPNATLGDALNRISKPLGLNAALKEGLAKLYGYASSEKGIRHANNDLNDKAADADAVFMVVACSAFITWLQAHALQTLKP